MKFSYDGADDSKIIKSYEKDGYNYEIQYLNGDIASYYSSNESEEQNIVNKMVEQIIERQEKINEPSLKLNKYVGLLTSVAASISLSRMINNENYELIIIPIICLVLGVSTVRTKKEMLNELKKYKMFLEMTESDPMRRVDDQWLDYIEFDKLYQIPLNINTIDQYSYEDVKLIYKKMKRKK